jgi:hypothetical protein
MRSFLALALLLQAYEILGQDITRSAYIKGVIPTAAGQIGVNPVTISNILLGLV